MEYVSLHHHSTMSFMDGFGTPAEHVNRAAELGMSALALTEHGNTASHVQLEQAACKAGIKPIFGLEAYTAPANMRETKNQRKWHLTVLAATQAGYTNLNQLVTRSWSEGFYRYPTISGAMLNEHNEGLLVTSGCADSKVACDLLGGKGRDVGSYEDALASVQRFKDLFGDRYYLEVQQFPELLRTRTLNSWYAEISRKLGIPLLATSDCHYPYPADNEMQKILHAAGRNTGTVAAAEAEWEYDILLTLPESDAAIIERLIGTGLTRSQAEQAVANTAEVASRCSVALPKADLLRFPYPPGATGKSLVWDWLRAGWSRRLATNAHMREHSDEYLTRMKYEMSIIEEKDFIDYFLMLSDIVSYAKDSGIPVGPARGSAAASLVCYLLRITEIDPMQFPTMVFERFIDVTRDDYPDIDLDFDDEQRYKIRERLAEIYGSDRVGNIGNFIKYRGKNSIVDVSRVYQIPEAQAKIVKDLIIDRADGDSRQDSSLEDTFETFPQAQAVMSLYPDIAHAMRLEGNYKGLATTAAGLVVANAPITDICALQSREVKGHKVEILPFDKRDVEYLGMLKVDILGLSTMGMINICLNLAGMTLEELYAIPRDNAETLAAFKRGDVTGIFQFEGRATRQINNDVSPDHFMELADINALSRPGPLFGGQTAAYIAVKQGKMEPESLHPVLDNITKDSKGQIVYQEQILRIVREIGGFDWGDAGAIRRIIGKKKGWAAFNAYLEQFVKGAHDLHGIEREVAEKIWKYLISSGTYAFNVGHSVSYSMLAFWQMWLKQHYPSEFYTAALTKASDAKGDDTRARLMRDAERHGVRIFRPNIETSGVTWSVARDPWLAAGERQGVVAGFSQVPGIGEKIAKLIVDNKFGFTEWSELEKIKGIGPKKVEMIRAMAESDDPFELEATGRTLNSIRGQLARNEFGFLPTPTHRSNEIPSDADDLKVTWLGFVKKRKIKDYIEAQRSATGETTEQILERTKDPHLLKSCSLTAYDEEDEEVYLRFSRWAYPQFKAALDGIKLDHHVVLAQGIKKKNFGPGIYVKSLWVIDPSAEETTDV